jgi:hypothetical protein
MKLIYKKSFVVAAIFLSLFLTGCNDFLNVNTDPNRASDDNMTADLIFPNAAVEVAALQANTFWSTTSSNFASSGNVTLNRWMGYWGWPGDYSIDQEETTYNITFSSSDGIWSRYYTTLFDLNQTETKSLAQKDSVLAGASMVLSVKMWQDMVDMFGDIPYTQAFQSTTYPQPAYDKAADIYTSLQASLDKAVTFLNKTAKGTFATTDIVFAGDVSSWIKFANTLKLRLLLRQSETTYKSAAPTAEITKIVNNGGLLLSGVEVNPGFTNSAGKQSPFYAAYGKTATGADASSTARANGYITSILNGDPRAALFFRPVSGKIVGTTYGLPAGNPNGSACSQPGPGVAYRADQNAWIIPGYEVQFMYAEAIARGWMTGNLKTAYENAIIANFNWLGRGEDLTDVAENDYLGAFDYSFLADAGTSVTDKVEFILGEKYIANCSVDALESWCDYRKMKGSFLPASVGGYSLLSVNPARGSNKIPLRWLYPQSEYTTNTNTPTNVTATTKLFWIPN